TLAEPPVVFAGDKVDETKQRLLMRARTAFAKGTPEEAVRAVIDSSQDGKYDKMPKPIHALLLRNAAELKALVTSEDMYPPLDRNAVRQIEVPTLLLLGENSAPSLKRGTEELEHLLKNCRRVLIAGADHGMWFQQPEACGQAVMAFLRGK